MALPALRFHSLTATGPARRRTTPSARAMRRCERLAAHISPPGAAPTSAGASPFSEPQVRSKRIRSNSGGWNPLLDLNDIHASNHHVVDADDGLGPRLELQEGSFGVELAVEPARRSAPLLEATEPWEKGEGEKATPIPPLMIWQTDDGSWRMLYDSKEGTCLATSADGRRWHRPSLGQVEFGGSTENNLLGHGISGATGVFIDTNPDCPPEQRFKAMGGDMGWYDPVTCEPLVSEEAGRRQRELDAWPEAQGQYQGPQAVIWGRTLGWTSVDGEAWTPMPAMLGNRPVPTLRYHAQVSTVPLLLSPRPLAAGQRRHLRDIRP